MRAIKTEHGYNPKVGLKAWNKIKNALGSPVESLSYMSVCELRRHIQPLPSVLTPRWTPKLFRPSSSFNWNQVFSNDLPPKIQELLWRAAHNNLPTKQHLSHFLPD